MRHSTFVLVMIAGSKREFQTPTALPSHSERLSINGGSILGQVKFSSGPGVPARLAAFFARVYGGRGRRPTEDMLAQMGCGHLSTLPQKERGLSNEVSFVRALGTGIFPSHSLTFSTFGYGLDGSSPVKPRSRAQTTAALRVCTSTFAYMAEMWLRTVLRARCNLAAI